MKLINIILISLFFSNFAYSIEDYPINGFEPEYQELQQPVPEEKIVPERIVQLQQSAQQFSEIIAEVQQKMTSSWRLETVITAWENVLNHLQQVASSLQNELYAKIASKEQFKDFYSSFVKLTSRLSDLNEQLIVPEFKIHEQDPSKISQLQLKANEIINKILFEVSSAVKLNFFNNFKEIEKIYASMAEHIKQEEETKEEQSRVQQQADRGAQQQTDIVYDDYNVGYDDSYGQGYYDNYDNYGTYDYDNYEY